MLFSPCYPGIGYATAAANLDVLVPHRWSDRGGGVLLTSSLGISEICHGKTRLGIEAGEALMG